jgi:hypothetical protein
LFKNSLIRVAMSYSKEEFDSNRYPKMHPLCTDSSSTGQGGIIW